MNTMPTKKNPRPSVTKAKSDRKVIDAFLDKKAAEGKKLSTDGNRLDGNWMGGRDLAHWENDRIVLPYTGGRSGDAVQRAIRKAAPKNWLQDNPEPEDTVIQVPIESNPRRSDLERYSVAELEAMPTLSEGHTDNLKVDDEIDGVPTRWWISRMTVEDGQKYAVEVEQLIDGRWQVTHGYGRPQRYADKYRDDNPDVDADVSARQQAIADRLALG